MASLLERTLGAVRKETASGEGNRRVSGGGQTRGSPYARPGNDSWKHDKFDADGEPRGEGSHRSTTRNAPASAGDASSGASAKLIIKNVHYEVSERELELLFVQANWTDCSWAKDQKGIAWVTYTNEKHAAQAKEAFNGALAKGEPLEIDFDYRVGPPPGPAAPGTLLARLGNNDGRGPRFASSADRGSGTRHVSGGAPTGPRSERGPGSGRGGARGSARGGRGGGAGQQGRDRVRKEPKTADDLDKELEAFMKTPENKPAGPAAVPSGGDIEMA
ncbi:hypothetical protein NBRC10512_001928 [Rhodotorula toruloides]|uniref:RNA binding protein n=1 Tax=Rhodotorula toruloides (strain NP11) TaxID=1130832 RepID=M7X7S3_RHOT1|nr:RNA binding protein [Rhodotorula toruloides NP11]EMS26145.1 RNA binding protein [Rhodotorula toruloides NP11]